MILLSTILCFVIKLRIAVSSHVDDKSTMVLQETEDCFDYGVDYVGCDLDDGHYVSTESASACQQSCQQTTDCLFWTWDPNYHSACWKKWGKGETRIDESLTSGPKFCDTPSTDDIRTMSYNTYGWNALHDDCNGWKSENIYKTIRAFNPDLLGAQEIGNCANKVAEHIGNDYKVAGISASHAILYRSSDFDMNGYGVENLTPQDKYGLRTVEYAYLTHKR